MAEQRSLAVSLFHRDNLSHGKSRRILSSGAYHWGIFVVHGSKEAPTCDVYDATDAAEIDPETWRMANPTMDWWLRIRPSFSLETDEKLLGYVIIGDVPDEVSNTDLKQLFEEVPLPVKNTHPQQSCVTWVVDAVSEIRRKGWAWDFDVDKLKDFALSFADRRLEGRETSKCVAYLSPRE